MADGADETMEVFGEAFMRLVRERLRLRVMVTTNTGSGGSGVSINIMLSDVPPDDPRGEKLICSEVVTIDVAAQPANPQLRGRNGY